MLRNIQDMVVVITGASAGIGRALASELSSRGARLVLGARRLEKLQELNRELGGAHECVACDVSVAADREMIIDRAIERFGRIDTLVCNAGFGFARPFDQMTSEDVRNIFETNFFGTVECCRLAVPLMKKQEPRDGWRGQLMIVSSACARRGLPYLSTYGATKAAQLSLAEGLRVELKPLGIAVTSVHPVLIETDFFNTACDLSGMDPAGLAQGARQSAATVAAKMARAIAKPTRELWPKPMSRVSLSIAVAIPAVVDKVMCKLRDRVLSDHRGNEDHLGNAKDPASCEAQEGVPAVR